MSILVNDDTPSALGGHKVIYSAHVVSFDVDIIENPNSLCQLNTPALLIEHKVLGRNIARMANLARAHAVSLRPHVKTHKSVEIARRQIAAGAVGVSCATLGEAEIMAQAGVPGVLVTSPVVTGRKIERLVRLARGSQPGGVMVVADDSHNVIELSRAAAGVGHPLNVLVDFAAGYGRTGIASPSAAVELAQQIERDPNLKLRGLQAYAGNIQHIPDRSRREKAAAAVRSSVQAVLSEARQCGIAFEIVTGAGTGTADLDARGKVFTELQPGSYVFMDAEYQRVLSDAGNSSPYEQALFVQTAVVSINNPDWVTVDGGTKCFSTDAGVPIVAHGVDSASRYAFFGDEHGKLLPIGERPKLGDRITFVPPHCDPTVNLHDAFHVIEDDKLIAIWGIDARGRH